MVTSTSTPASMLTMICLTISVGAFRLYESRRQSANAKSMHSKLKNILVMGGEKGEEGDY